MVWLLIINNNKKMENILVSVIMPIYNAEATLKMCLNSVANQDYPNYEIILVDNNSNDSTKNIIDDFQKKYKNIKYFFEKQKGVGKARNLGISGANGQVLCFIDSDCVAPGNWI